MVLLSLQGLSAAQIAVLLDTHRATVRRWIGRFNAEGLAGLADRPRPGRPPLGGKRLASRIAALLGRPGPWTLPRIWRYLGRPQVSMRALYRRVARVAIWRRPKADRPRRPLSRPRGGRHHRPADRTAAPGRGVRPGDVGLPAGLRRRTPGLRREEVVRPAGRSRTPAQRGHVVGDGESERPSRRTCSLEAE